MVTPLRMSLGNTRRHTSSRINLGQNGCHHIWLRKSLYGFHFIAWSGHPTLTCTLHWWTMISRNVHSIQVHRVQREMTLCFHCHTEGLWLCRPILRHGMATLGQRIAGVCGNDNFLHGECLCVTFVSHGLKATRGHASSFCYCILWHSNPSPWWTRMPTSLLHTTIPPVM